MSSKDYETVHLFYINPKGKVLFFVYKDEEGNEFAQIPGGDAIGLDKNEIESMKRILNKDTDLKFNDHDLILRTPELNKDSIQFICKSTSMDPKIELKSKDKYYCWSFIYGFVNKKGFLIKDTKGNKIPIRFSNCHFIEMNDLLLEELNILKYK